MPDNLRFGKIFLTLTLFRSGMDWPDELLQARAGLGLLLWEGN